MPLKTTFEELFVKKSFQTHQILGYQRPELFKLSTRFMAFGTARKRAWCICEKNSTCELILYKPSQYQISYLVKLDISGKVTNPLDGPGFRSNTRDDCYRCRFI